MRAVTVRRVTNPDDESQYLDVEVIREITFRGPNGQVMACRLLEPTDQRATHIKRITSPDDPDTYIEM